MAQNIGSGFVQFRAGSIAICHANGKKAVMFGSKNIVLAVADHCHICRGQLFRLKNVGQKIGFVGAGSIQLASVDTSEIRIQSEMRKDGNRIGRRFGGSDEQPPAGALERLKHRFHARVNSVLEQHSLRSIAFPVQLHRRLNRFGVVRLQQSGERGLYGRADKGKQFVTRGNRQT